MSGWIAMNEPTGSETEALILANTLIVLGGIAAGAGFVELWSGGALALIGLFMFGVGFWLLWKAFKYWQWPQLKATAVVYMERFENERQK